MSVRTAVLLCSAALATLAAGCYLTGSDTISEERAARYAEANRELAASLPVPPQAKVVREATPDCTGALVHERSAACVLHRTYETTSPLTGVLKAYHDYFLTAGWMPLERGSEATKYYRNEQFLVQVSVAPGVRSGACADGAEDSEAYRECLSRELRRDDGLPSRFLVIVGPR